MDMTAANNNEGTNSNMLEKEGIQVGMFKAMTANAVIEKAKTEPEQRDLFRGLWNEGELACLFADSNVGKSIFAVQMAEEISTKQTVLYFDCELSDRQFSKRYSNQDCSRSHHFPDNFIRSTIEPGAAFGGSYEDAFIRDVENLARNLGTSVIIIDNLTYLCNSSEKGDLAAELMMKLMSLKMKYAWSMLIIAHTPKRDLSSPLDANDLAGSKKIFNFFDTIFALGKCRHDEGRRYLKQIKCRSAEFTYTEDNVMVFDLEKDDDGYLHFEAKGADTEDNLLSRKNYDAIQKSICSQMREGKSYREIGDAINLSKSTVGRYAKKCTDVSCQPKTTIATPEQEDSLEPM